MPDDLQELEDEFLEAMAEFKREPSEAEVNAAAKDIEEKLNSAIPAVISAAL